MQPQSLILPNLQRSCFVFQRHVLKITKLFTVCLKCVQACVRVFVCGFTKNNVPMGHGQVFNENADIDFQQQKMLQE